MRKERSESSRKRAPIVLLVVLLVILGIATGACKKTPSPTDDGGAPGVDASRDLTERTPDIERLWIDAKEGDETLLARLADREGAIGLVERSSDARYRTTALLAMAYSKGFVALPTLADAAKNGSEVDALAAADSAAQLSSNVRSQTDPEDALELREGCTRFLDVAKDTARARLVRVGAVRTLRLLRERGCNMGDIPTDVDVK